jgi:hypothetical protein
MFNSKNLGALIVDEDPHVKSFEDNRYGIQEMSIEETYGLGIVNEGQAIGTALNIKIRPNEFTLPARTVFNLSEQNSTFQNIEDVAVFGTTPVDVNNQDIALVLHNLEEKVANANQKVFGDLPKVNPGPHKVS